MNDGASEFDVKRIRFRGQDTCMLMQNANGPCPLLALSNVLFLRGALTPPHPDLPKVHISELTAMLVEYMLETNQPSETNAELRANQQQNIQDALSLFPKLQRGLDVNVKFDRVDAFEYSEDLLLFDLLNVRLLHGWLVDPQDRETCAAVGKLTYNGLVERIIEFRTRTAPEPPPPPSAAATPTHQPEQPVHPAPPQQQQTAPPAGRVEEGEEEELQRALELSMASDGGGAPSAPPSPPRSASPSEDAAAGAGAPPLGMSDAEEEARD